MEEGLMESIRKALPEEDLKARRQSRRRKRIPCWSCPILTEMNTMSGVNVVQQLESVLGSIRALTHECRKRHEARERRRRR